jgi:hypothetical protein
MLVERLLWFYRSVSLSLLGSGWCNVMHSSITVGWGLSHALPDRLLTLTPNPFFLFTRLVGDLDEAVFECH